MKTAVANVLTDLPLLAVCIVLSQLIALAAAQLKVAAEDLVLLVVAKLGNAGVESPKPR